MTRPSDGEVEGVDLDELGMALAELPRFPWRRIEAADDDVVVLLPGGFAHLCETQEKAMTYLCNAVPELIRIARERDEAIGVRDLRAKAERDEALELLQAYGQCTYCGAAITSQSAAERCKPEHNRARALIGGIEVKITRYGTLDSLAEEE